MNIICIDPWLLSYQERKGERERERHNNTGTISNILSTVYSNLANVSSLLWHAFASLPSPSSSVNWAGFYVRSDKFPGQQLQNQKQDELLLGPFNGKPACQQIRFGKGVCGTAASKRETVLVHDVFQFPGHIACDAESRSEIVVPILVNGEVCISYMIFSF